MPRIRTIAFASLSITLGILLSSFLVEVIVRTFFAEPMLPRFVRDSGYGVRANIPNVDTYHFYPDEYRVRIRTNNMGLRGSRNYEREKPNGVLRIALLGDSFIFGHGVNDNEVASSRLEMMYRQAGAEAEVLNFGVSGFGQAEELITFENIVQKYDPDYVVIFYFNNDIGNNTISGLYVLNEFGDLERTENDFLPGVKAREILYGNPVTLWLFTHSQAWNLLRNKLSFIVQRRMLRDQGLTTFAEVSDTGSHLTIALLSQLVESIEGSGATAVIFVIPTIKNQSNFPMEADAVNKFIDGRVFLNSEDYYPKDEHWRASGHDKAARRIFEILGDSD